jgi:hypothetical protein
MASTAKAGQTARQKARERRIALEAETKERNDRIENWTTKVFTGVEERDQALQAAASAEDAMADGLIGLAGEGLTTSEVADLCEMTQGEVTKLVKRRREANGGADTASTSSAAKSAAQSQRQEPGTTGSAASSTAATTTE